MSASTSLHEHWQTVYQTKIEQQTSWFRQHLDQSLRLIDGQNLAHDAPIIDVGAGRSTLVDDLLVLGYTDITVLDLSGAALDQARSRVESISAADGGQAPTAESAARVKWIAADILEAKLPAQHYGLWHDRAVFHFLTKSANQARYAAQAKRSIREGGLLMLATFALDGPEKCSGLPVCRYDATTLAHKFSDGFVPIADDRETHPTPFGTEQQFTYLVLRRADATTRHTTD
jgi:SAM-dependent methyltransferase